MRMAKVAVSGCWARAPLAPGVLTVAVLLWNQRWANRTERFGPHGQGSEPRIVLVGQPNRSRDGVNLQQPASAELNRLMLSPFRV